MIRRNTLLQSNVTEKPCDPRSSPRIAPLLRLEILNAQNHRSTESHQSRRVNRVFQQPANLTESQTKRREGKRQASDMMSDSDFSGGAGMKRRREGAESRFTAFVEGLTSVIGHADRAKPLHDYCTGLVMPCERKSVEPMAAVTTPANVGAHISRY